MHMPSQNLPKPNLPGQINQMPASAPAPAAAAPAGNQTVFAQKPDQLRQAQVVPGGLSRENPGGTPPNMKVAALAQEPVLQRPSGPLDQISLKNPSQPPSSQPVRPTPPVAPPSNPSVTAAATKPSPAPAASSPKAAPNPEKAKSKLPLPLIIGGAVLLVLLLIFLLFSLFKPKTTTNKTNTNTKVASDDTPTPPPAQITTLTYWGLWEDSQILKEVIADFESKNPTIKIDYRKQSHRDYRERLQQAIISGNGPDIFRYHVAWVPMLSANLAAMPSTVMSTAEYKQIFYPTAANNLQVGGQIVGIPLMYDGLALFYNKEMLKTANLSVPSTWAELRTTANKLTVPANISERQSGITRAGLAIGNAGNVDHFSDILALLIIQNGGNPADASSQYVKDAVTFYTNFIKQDKVWSDRLANSTTAFAKGDVAMIFAPSWRVHDIKNLNPNLDFAVARLPQLDSEKPATWATFWAEGVSAKSKNKDAAWAFLKYLSTPEVLRKFYNDASQYRAFGEIYPRTDMASELQSSELVGAYVEDAPLAKSWYMSSFTHDNGLNDQIIKYYEDAINAVLAGENAEKALEPTTTGVTSVLSKYSSSK